MNDKKDVIFPDVNDPDFVESVQDMQKFISRIQKMMSIGPETEISFIKRQLQLINNRLASMEKTVDGIDKIALWTSDGESTIYEFPLLLDGKAKINKLRFSVDGKSQEIIITKTEEGYLLDGDYLQGEYDGQKIYFEVGTPIDPNSKILLEKTKDCMETRFQKKIDGLQEGQNVLTEEIQKLKKDIEKLEKQLKDNSTNSEELGKKLIEIGNSIVGSGKDMVDAGRVMSPSKSTETEKKNED